MSAHRGVHVFASRFSRAYDRRAVTWCARGTLSDDTPLEFLWCCVVLRRRTYSLATDYVSHGIRCNAICPARIHTPFVVSAAYFSAFMMGEGSMAGV